MKIRIPVMIQDQMVANMKSMFKPTEPVEIEEAFFLDGPVSERVAVVDFEKDGKLGTPAKFTPPAVDREFGFYEGAEPKNPEIDSETFIQVNVLGTVLRTIHMFEEKDTLGRRVTWGFEAPQLLIIPRAGKWPNAYYERDSHSLQFFYFPSERKIHKGRTVFTSLSHDIIAHETGHAILDGIARDLYNCITPQSLALHEAIADLTAVVMAFRSEELRKIVLRQTGGLIRKSTAFSSIAEEFGVLKESVGKKRPLRNLLNKKILPDHGGIRISPHNLSEVLSGALYEIVVKMHENRKKTLRRFYDYPKGEIPNIALKEKSDHFKRMVFRALDYLPPGEVSFADYGRAIIAADRASHPDLSRERNWIAREFVKRNIVPDEASLLEEQISESEKSELNAALSEIDMYTLANSDWAAYELVNRKNIREILRIPNGIPCWVRPRLDCKKKYWSRHDTKEVRECIFKVSWDSIEENPHARGLPRKRQITVGTTMAIDWEEKTVRTFLTSDTSANQKNDRNDMLLHLHTEGRLKIGKDAFGPDGKPLNSVVIAELSGDLMRVRNSARMLHIEGFE